MDKDGESCRQWAVVLIANLAEFAEHLQFFPCLVQRKEMFILEEEECIVGKSLAEHRSEAVVGNEAVDAVFFWAECLDLGIKVFSIALHVRSERVVNDYCKPTKVGIGWSPARSGSSC